MSWHLVEPGTPYSDNWHIKLICDHLEAVSRGEILRLLINIPPGCMKSLLVGVFWPAWDWAVKNSGRKWMYASYDALLTRRDAQRTRELVTSHWFRQRWGDLADKEKLAALQGVPVEQVRTATVLEASPDRANTATLYWTSQAGMRFATSFGGRATGWHAHIQVVDDPTKPADIQKGGEQARTALAETKSTWKGTFSTRKADPKTFARVIVMQRLHTDDLAGLALAETESEEDDYVRVILPMEFDPDRRCWTDWGRDPREEPGELLWPDRYDKPSVDKTRRDLGPRDAAAQLDQLPSPESGGIFRRPWFALRWGALPAGVTMVQSWDASFKDASTSDYVVGQLWAKLGARYYLVDQVRDRLDFPSFIQAIKDWSLAWPEARTKLIEAKANGIAAIAVLQNEVSGLLEVEPLGGKEARANAASRYWEAGNVYLPEGQRWVEEFIKEHTDFPTGSHDDQVDAGSQALLWFEAESGDVLAQAMIRARSQRLGREKESKSRRVVR